MRRIALLAGATGLVGRELLPLLLDDSEIAEVVVLSRRAIATPHPKLQQGIVAFDQLHNFVLPPVDDFYCCLGTTIRQAGSREAFREVDLVYPVTIARMALAAGATRCLFVSAMGADVQSRVFYNRIKGELERDLMRLELRDRLRVPAVAARRQSRGIPRRRSASRWRSRGRCRSCFRRPSGPIAAADVACAMHACGRRTAIGRFVILSDEIRRIAAKSQFLRLGSSTSPQF